MQYKSVKGFFGISFVLSGQEKSNTITTHTQIRNKNRKEKRLFAFLRKKKFRLKQQKIQPAEDICHYYGFMLNLAQKTP